jgi:predicted transcriptional regulator
VSLGETYDLTRSADRAASPLHRAIFHNRNVGPTKGVDELTEDTERRNADLIRLTADIVAAFVQNNSVPVAGLPDLISSVNAALSGLNQPTVIDTPIQAPAVNPKKSVLTDYIISLEDGRKFKSMKRHLGLLGMTPDEYRAKWGLARDYPMVAPSYAAKRSELAKSIGLGRKPTAKAPIKKAPARKTVAK